MCFTFKLKLKSNSRHFFRTRCVQFALTNMYFTLISQNLQMSFKWKRRSYFHFIDFTKVHVTRIIQKCSNLQHYTSFFLHPCILQQQIFKKQSIIPDHRSWCYTLVLPLLLSSSSSIPLFVNLVARIYKPWSAFSCERIIIIISFYC